jgi:hypothetical protein
MHLTYRDPPAHTGVVSAASAETGAPVVAEFRPKRTDDLKSDALPLVGQTGLFEPLWRISGGEYDGQWAMRIPRDWPIESAVWIPECDLRRVS